MKKKINFSLASIKGKNISPVFAAGVVWMIMGFMYSMRYIIVHGRAGIFSDLSAEMVLADLLNKEHTLISGSWFYPTEIHVLQYTTLLQVGLIFSPHNWYVARIIASAIDFVLVGIAYFYFAKGIGMKEYAPWGAGFLLWPFSNLWLTWNVEYGFNTLFPLFTLGIIMNYRQEYGRVKKILLILFGCLLGFFSGLNGPKMLFSFYIACAGAFLVCLVISAGDSAEADFKGFLKSCRKDIVRAAFAVLFLVSNLVGYLFNHVVLSSKYTFMDYESETQWLSSRNLTYDELLDSFIRIFGYSSDCQVVSFEGIASLIGLLLGVLIVMCIIWCLARVKRLDPDQRPAAAICFVGFFFCFTIFCYMTGYNNWHWTTQYPFYITAILLVIKNTNDKVKTVNMAVLLALGLSIMILSRNTVNLHVNRDIELGAEDQVVAAEYLESEGIRYGIAMAWSAQKVEELTSGKVEMFAVDSYNYGYLPSHWLQKKSHLNPPPSGERVAVVIADLECAGNVYDLDIIKYGDYMTEKDIGTIHVFVFDSYDKISAAFDTANAER